MPDQLPPIDSSGSSSIPDTLSGELQIEPSSIEDLQKWRNRVTAARKLRENWEFEWQVEKCENYFLGRQAIELGEMVINYTYAAIKTQKPNLLLHSPKFLVRSKPGKVSPVTERQAAIGEGILQSIADQDFNLESAGELALTQAYFRVGVLKCVYDPQLESNPQAGSPIYNTNEAGEPTIDQATIHPLISPDGKPVINPQTGQPQIDPESLGFKPMADPQTGEPIIEPDMVVDDEIYRWEFVDSKNMLLPDEGPDQRRWTWIGEEVAVPLAQAKEDERFPADLRDRFHANESPADRVRRRGSVVQIQSAEQDPLPDEEIFKYYECYDLLKHKWYIFADGQDFDEFIIYDDLPDGIEDHPYAILSFDPILGPRPSSWPIPRVFNWMPIQREYNIRRQQISEGAKRSARKILFDDATFDDSEEAVKALQSARDMEAAKVRDIAHLPHMMESQTISNDVYRDIPLLLTDWYVVTGQTGARMGAPSAQTATESSFVERAGNLRDSDMQHTVFRWLSIAGRKMLQLVRKTLTLDVWVRMRGWDEKEIIDYAARVYGLTPDLIKLFPGIKQAMIERLGQEKMVQITRDQLDFEAEVTVTPGSTRPRSLDVERSQWLEFLQLIGQFPQLALSRELLHETGKKFEFVSERMMDELGALALKMVAIQQQTAGHGGSNGGPENTPKPGSQGALASREASRGSGGAEI